MTKIRCIAVDDEPFALEIIADDIQKVPYLELVGKFTNTASVSYLLPEVDLIFLDINMPIQTGIQFLKELQSPPMVIFTTAYHDYAIDGFDLKVVDYLLKPIPFERFLQATDRALELFTLKTGSIQKPASHSFVIFSEYKQIKIFSDEILYIEGLKDYVKIYLANQAKPILTRLTLNNTPLKTDLSG